MNEATLTRRDRAVGIALLIAGVLIGLVPDFRLAGQLVDLYYVGMPWILAAVLLLTAHLAGRPNLQLSRRGAAILFVFGFASPFIVNLINSSLGA